MTVCLVLQRRLVTDGGPGKGCRLREPSRPVLLEVDRGQATWLAGALGGLAVPVPDLGLAAVFFFFCILFTYFIFYFWPLCVARGILVPRPGNEPATPAVGAQSLNH